ncbi:MAG: isoleucine--tRNA ligase [Oscillospiraceae bacterium]|nr:isoleucine--tRNA ligase [Oscillospiraceae bacterium]
MYEKVATDLDFASRELGIIDFWKENDIINKSLNHRKGCEIFTFYDGPPTANGKPHIGHVITRAVKDIIPRHRSMKGYDVCRKAGWDTHGLPVELEVEKMLGIDGKPQIEEYGVAPFIEKCKESVWAYKSNWQDMSERVAYWADMDNAYVTYTNDYIESVWWSLKQIWDRGLIYQGHKVVPFCPRCGTALSSHEVAQGYKDVVEPSIYVKFKVAGKQDEYFLAWTTTPWTLPSNTTLVVHPDYEYVKVEWRGSRYILAKELVGPVFGVAAGTAETADPVVKADTDKNAGAVGAADAADAANAVNAADAPKIVDEYKGSELCGVEYEPLFDFIKPDKKAWFVCADRYVTLSEGTGIVHAAPAFGEDDARIGRDNSLPFIQLVDVQGRFVDEARLWAGMFVKDADPLIIKELDNRGLLLGTVDMEHSYPFCWRCDTSLLYYARNTWFIRMTELRDNLVRNNNTINWLPDNVKHGRFGNFLDNVVDWGLSRERYWGTPLPIWICGGHDAQSGSTETGAGAKIDSDAKTGAGADGGAKTPDGACGYRHAVGSRAELYEMGIAVPEDLDFHKPYIDDVRLRCPKCGGLMTRVPEVIDCWYDAGSMPFAQWHYPFENKGLFEKNFPADFISEAVDQTRGWFYTLLAISTLLFDEASFKNCIVLGHVQDKDGRKMSKHLYNVIDPWEALDLQGADAVRWYYFSASAPWLPSRFSLEAVSEIQRKFMGTLWNTYAFYVLYAQIDGFDPTAHKLIAQDLDIMDRWILSRLNSLIKTVDEDLTAYRITEPTRAITLFADELSNWYVRRCRERYWQGGMEKDKIAAYMTLYTVLYDLSRLISPFVPFVSEMIYQNIVRGVDKAAPLSIHLCDYPSYDSSLIDAELEAGMRAALDVVTLGRACRNAANIKNRQPLKTIYVVSENRLGGEFHAIVKDELNIRELEFSDASKEFVSYKFKPQLKTLGPRYGKLLPKIGAHLAAVDGDAAMGELSATGFLRFSLNGGSGEGNGGAESGSGSNSSNGGAQVELSADDLLIETAQRENFVAQSDGGITVAIDTQLTEELLEEGNTRELISKIQNMRKEAGFEVTNHILLGVRAGGDIGGAFGRNFELIARETLADGALGSVDEGGAFRKEWAFGGEQVVIAIKKV